MSNNVWFAIEDREWADALKKSLTTTDVTPTWFPSTGEGARPFPYLLEAIQTARIAKVEALFYQSHHQPLPALRLLQQVPTIVALDGAPLRPFIREPRRASGQAFIAFLRKIKQDEKLMQAVGQVAGFVVWSNWARQTLIDTFGVAANRVLVARTGVDLKAWDAACEAFQIARRPAHNLPERIRILFAGNDFKALGGDLLLNAFKTDSDLAELCELHLITRRASAASYLEELDDSVKLPIYLHAFDAPAELYLNSDIYVLPARGSSSPSQLATALAAGLPIVASRVAGLDELVKDEQNGLLVAPNDLAALRQALHRLVDDPTLRYELGQRSRKVAETQFQIETTTKQLTTFIRQISRNAQLIAKTVPIQKLAYSQSSVR